MISAESGKLFDDIGSHLHCGGVILERFRIYKPNISFWIYIKSDIRFLLANPHKACQQEKRGIKGGTGEARVTKKSFYV